MPNVTFRLVVLIVILSALVLIQGYGTPVAAQRCIDPASGREIPCPPQPLPGQPPTGRDDQLSQPKVGELCSAKPTIDYFKAWKKGNGLFFDWDVRDAQSVRLDFVGAAGIKGFTTNTMSTKPTTLEYLFSDYITKFTGMTSATLTASCPPYEVVATLNPSDWSSNPDTNTNKPGIPPPLLGEPPPPPPPTDLVGALAALACLGLSAAFMMTTGGLGVAKKLLDDPSMKWLKDMLCTIWPHSKIFGCDDSE